MTTEAVSRDRLIARLSTGEELPLAVEESILAEGATAIPALLSIAQDEDLADEEAVGGGWPPVHAVELLAKLEAVEAIDTFLEIILETEVGAAIWDTALVWLPKIGPAVLEPTLAALKAAKTTLHFDALCSALAQLGVRDERIFAALSKAFEADAMMGSMSFADYGDPRALPLVEGAIRTFVPVWNDALGVRDLVELVQSYEKLGGPLPADLTDHVAGLRAEWARRWAARGAKIGRNDPCPCKSGKKHKKCCLGKPAST